MWADKGFTLVKDKYGAIPTDVLGVHAARACSSMTPALMIDLAYFVIAIVFVAAVESLLCSRMADRLADNQGTPYNPNKELWGQGLVQVDRAAAERLPAHRRAGAHGDQHQARARSRRSPASSSAC